jgi:hypothetical protein
MKGEKCYLTDPKWNQCCCNCVHHMPVHLHCSTVVSKQGRHGCVCDIQTGWACVLFGQVYTNWDEHSIGCEEYCAKKEA